MTEKELLDMIFSERIDALLRLRPRNSQDDAQEVSRLINQAERLLQHLPKEEWTMTTRYMDHQTDRLADNAAYLYYCGITDGIRLMKYIAAL